MDVRRVSKNRRVPPTYLTAWKRNPAFRGNRSQPSGLGSRQGEDEDSDSESEALGGPAHVPRGGDGGGSGAEADPRGGAPPRHVAPGSRAVSAGGGGG